MSGHFRADDAGPNEPVIGPSTLIEDVLELLEKHNIPEDVCDEVVSLLEEYEGEQP